MSPVREVERVKAENDGNQELVSTEQVITQLLEYKVYYVVLQPMGNFHLGLFSKIEINSATKKNK